MKLYCRFLEGWLQEANVREILHLFLILSVQVLLLEPAEESIETFYGSLIIGNCNDPINEQDFSQLFVTEWTYFSWMEQGYPGAASALACFSLLVQDCLSFMS